MTLSKKDIIVDVKSEYKQWRIGTFIVRYCEKENEWKMIKNNEVSDQTWIHDFIIESFNLPVRKNVRRVKE